MVLKPEAETLNEKEVKASGSSPKGILEAAQA